MTRDNPVAEMQAATGLGAVRTFLGIVRSIKGDQRALYDIADKHQISEALPAVLRSLNNARRLEKILTTGLVAINGST